MRTTVIIARTLAVPSESRATMRSEPPHESLRGDHAGTKPTSYAPVNATQHTR
jgi:hypothetical protein